jgi:excisionase family DNA binding protein
MYSPINPTQESLRETLGHAPTVREVAKYLDCHQSLIYRLLYEGKLAVLRQFSTARVSIASLERLLTDERDYLKTNPRKRKPKDRLAIADVKAPAQLPSSTE